MNIHNKRSLLEIRRSLRAESTQAEGILWQHLRNRKLDGLKFKRQHSIGNYIVDFYCASKRLIVEVDGEVHHSKEQREKDESRDRNLTEMGFKIIRITNARILFEMEEVKKLIRNLF